MKTPRLPKGWTWDLDRTGDIVAIAVRNHKRWLVADACLVADPRTFPLHLQRLRLVALWNSAVYRPIENWYYRQLALATMRREAQTERHMAYAASVDGLYDHAGEKIDRPLEPLAEWEKELLAASQPV